MIRLWCSHCGLRAMCNHTVEVAMFLTSIRCQWQRMQVTKCKYALVSVPSETLVHLRSPTT